MKKGFYHIFININNNIYPWEGKNNPYKMKQKIQRKPSVTIALIIGVVLIVLVSIVVFSNKSVILKLNFFGTGLNIEKTE